MSSDFGFSSSAIREAIGSICTLSTVATAVKTELPSMLKNAMTKSVKTFFGFGGTPVIPKIIAPLAANRSWMSRLEGPMKTVALVGGIFVLLRVMDRAKAQDRLETHYHSVQNKRPENIFREKSGFYNTFNQIAKAPNPHGISEEGIRFEEERNQKLQGLILPALGPSKG